MFANLFANQTVLAALGALLVATAIQDIRHLTIPNRYCLAIALLYPVFVLTSVHGVDWVDGARIGAASLALGFLLFVMRLAGAGDVKFFAAISLWAGSSLIVDFVMITALVGGVIAAAMLIHRRLTAPARPPPGARLRIDQRFPGKPVGGAAARRRGKRHAGRDRECGRRRSRFRGRRGDPALRRGDCHRWSRGWCTADERGQP